MPDEWSRRKVLKLATPLKSFGPRIFGSVEGKGREEWVRFYKRQEKLVLLSVTPAILLKDALRELAATGNCSSGS